jgi:hypothetical protein
MDRGKKETVQDAAWRRHDWRSDEVIAALEMLEHLYPADMDAVEPVERVAVGLDGIRAWDKPLVRLLNHHQQLDRIAVLELLLLVRDERQARRDLNWLQ